MSAELLARVQAFEIDDGPVALAFAARLAREHGWPRRFADRVVAEYKRFAYLAATAGHPVTPSQAVDHCWHLHLTYTRSYWLRFCREVLPVPLHHTPTAGGPAEQRRYHVQYEQTLAAYRSAFGHAPPADIWPPAGVRFGDDLREVTVNTAANWVVSKDAVCRAVAAASLAGLVVVGAVGCGGGLNPFDLVGPQFLGVLIPAMLAAVVAGLVLRALAKSTGGDGEPPTDWQSAALLAGGPQRLLAATVARLTQSGAVRVSGDGSRLEATGPAPPDATPVERTVLTGLPVAKTNALRMLRLAQELGETTTDTRQRLEDDGLILSDAASKRAGWLACLPLAAVLLGLGLPRLVAGLANGKPVGYLVIALVIGGVVALGLRAARPYRTRAGDRAKAELAVRYADAGVETGDAAPDRAMTVAALGTAALAGTELAALHAWYPKRAVGGGDGSGGGCGSDGGGGGDGGGGCGGGCGGCGGGD